MTDLNASLSSLRVAIVHDWLLGMRGGERCLEEILTILPNSDLYTLFYNPSGVTEKISSKKVTTSILGSLPGVKKYYRYLLPFYPLATMLLSRKLKQAHAEKPYDFVLSVSHCAAKNIVPPTGVKHLCYCLTPARYIWDQFDIYFPAGILRFVAQLFRGYLQRWDCAGAKLVTAFLPISEYINARLKRYYAREGEVVYPPVRSDWLKQTDTQLKKGYYLVVTALVPYKNTKIIVEAFYKLNQQLIVIGNGPELSDLRKLANKNIEFIQRCSEVELAQYYQQAKALVFAAEDDFGMVVVESLAAGTPVIALGRGGAVETISTPDTGIFFNSPEVEDVVDAVSRFEVQVFDSERCRQQGERFSLERFKTVFESCIQKVIFSNAQEKRTDI